MCVCTHKHPGKSGSNLCKQLRNSCMYTHTYIHTYVYTHTHTHGFTHTCMHINMSICHDRADFGHVPATATANARQLSLSASSW